MQTTYGIEKFSTRYLTNGFVGSCMAAYNHHYHLSLSPDDVWIAITTSLARYVMRII